MRRTRRLREGALVDLLASRHVHDLPQHRQLAFAAVRNVALATLPVRRRTKEQIQPTNNNNPTTTTTTNEIIIKHSKETRNLLEVHPGTSKAYGGRVEQVG
jgi:hypothetical protein